MALLRKPPEWGVEPVPPRSRVLGFADLLVLWFSLGIGLLVIQAGALLTAAPSYGGLGLPLGEAIIVILVGSVVGSALLALAGLPGSRDGVPTMVSLRPLLGLRGSYVPSAINVLQLIGWTGFEVYIMAHTAALATGDFMGWATAPLLLLFFSAWCTLMALGGPLVVVRKWLERFGIWLVLGSSGWITYRAVTTPTVQASLPAPWVSGVPVALALDLVIAMPVSWWPLVSDYNRFARRPARGGLGTLVGYSIANTWFYALGAALLLLSPEGDALAAAVALALGSLAIVPILVDETDNAFADIYSSAVSLQNIRPTLRQRRLIVAVAGMGVALGLYLLTLGASAAQVYEIFLLLVGGIFVPLLGAMISHHLLAVRGDPVVGSPWVAGVAWALGTVTYFAIYAWSYSQSLGGLGSSLPSFLVALGVHQVLARRLALPRPGGGIPGAVDARTK